jgi:hypothetical protein
MGIQRSWNAGHFQYGFHFGSEQNPVWLAGNVERLLTQAVARQDKPGASGIPQRDSKHSTKTREEVEALFFIKVNDDFSIRIASENVSAGFELGAEFLEVIYLAVTHGPHGLVLVGNGLVPAFEINDAEAAHADCYSIGTIVPMIVRSPVNHDLSHGGQNVLTGPASLP